MRVVTWNLAYWTPSAVYNTVGNRRRQWHFLLSLNADVILLQECRPGDLATVDDAASGYRTIGTIPNRWTACAAILARDELRLESAPRPGPWFDYLSGYLAVATICSPRGRVFVSSVHTPAKFVEDPSVTPEDHESLRRPSSDRAWHNDLAFAALDALPKEAGFIIGGDWNTARLFDQQPSDFEGSGAGVEFFDRASKRGWAESLRKYHPAEIRTFLRPGTQPYELDHIFTDPGLNERLGRCEVLVGLPTDEMSDHAPVIAEFAL